MIGAKYWRFVSSVRGTPGIAAEGAAWVPATSADDLPTDEGEPEHPVPSGPRYGIALISRYPVRGWRVKRFPPAPVSMPLLAPTLVAPAEDETAELEDWDATDEWETQHEEDFQDEPPERACITILINASAEMRTCLK